MADVVPLTGSPNTFAVYGSALLRPDDGGVVLVSEVGWTRVFFCWRDAAADCKHAEAVVQYEREGWRGNGA